MVDSSKRNSLKSLGGLAAMPFVPLVIAPAVAHANSTVNELVIDTATNNEELSISMVLGENPSMKVTNNSDSVTILRRIHPGVVHAGSKSYDLNHSFATCFYAIDAGRSRTIPITEATSSVAETVFPLSNSDKPLKIAAISADNTDGRILNASRVFFA